MAGPFKYIGGDARVISIAGADIIGPLVDSATEAAQQSRDWATGVASPDGLGTASSKTWAGESEVAALQSANSAAAAMAFVGGVLFQSSALGLAGTVDGQHFAVAAPGDDALILYRNVAGVATELNRYPSSEYLRRTIDRRTVIKLYGNSIGAAPGMNGFLAQLVNHLNGGGANPIYVGDNGGASGENSTQILARGLDDLAVGNVPDIAILATMGTNDGRQGVAASVTLSNVETLADALKAAGTQKVVGINDLPWKGYVDGGFSWTSAKQAQTDAYNAGLASIASIDHLIDAYSDFESSAGSDTMKAAYDSGDKLHPNQAGQDRLFALLAALPADTWPVGTETSLQVAGKAKVNQDLTDTAIVRHAGAIIGPAQTGFGPLRALFRALYNATTGWRGISIGGAMAALSRVIAIDGTWSIEGISTEDTTYNQGRMYRIKAINYTSGGCSLVFGTANGAANDIVDQLFLMTSGWIGVGAEPTAPFSIAAGGIHRDFNVSSGRALTRVADRSGGGNTVVPDDSYALSHHFFVGAAGTTQGLDVTDTAITVHKPLLAGSAGKNIGDGGTPFNTAYVTQINAYNAAQGAAGRAADLRSVHPGYEESVLFLAHGATPQEDAKLITGFDLNYGTVFQIDGFGDVKNLNNVYGAISDRRLKQDIRPAGSQWDDINALAKKVKKYRLKADVKRDPKARFHIGGIAQDWEKISPGLVVETPEMRPVTRRVGGKTVQDAEPTGRKIKTISYSLLPLKMLPVVGELQDRVVALEARLAEIQADLASRRLS